MSGKYKICEETVRDVGGDGEMAGFASGIRTADYRALRLSMAEPLEMPVDGKPAAAGAMRSGVRGPLIPSASSPSRRPSAGSPLSGQS